MAFKDVDQNAWYQQYVENVYHKKIMTGLKDSEFGPNDSLARAQFAVILYRMNGGTGSDLSAKVPRCS